MLTQQQCELVEDATGITPEQMRRLERVAIVTMPPTLCEILAMAAKHPFCRSDYGCPSEAH